jgi:DNA-binding GntR family transcriptional regulator
MMNTKQIYLRLQEAIAAGEFAPGSALDERALMARFGVSRTPVREALLKLSALGYVEILPRAGIYVTKLTAKDLLSLFEMMAELEGMCARLCARRMTLENKQALQRLHVESRKAVETADVEAYVIANKRFHELLYASCMNRFLVEQLLHIRQRTAPYRRHQLTDPVHIARSWKEHAAIVDAMLAADEDQAQHHASQHIAISGREFADFVAQLPESLPAALTHQSIS